MRVESVVAEQAGGQGRHGVLVVAAGAGARIDAFDLVPGDLIDQQCARPGDVISRDEWDIYLPGVPYTPPCQR